MTRRIQKKLSMIKLVLTLLAFLWLTACRSQSPSWTLQNSPSNSNLRGVSVVNDHVVWASGNRGTCLRTIDAGQTWTRIAAPGSDSLDFRDVEAFDENAAYLLSIGPGNLSRIYKTTNGGKSWAIQFMNKNPKAFFDAMAFWDSENGVAFSDPVDGKLVVIKTTNGGMTWLELPAERIPAALPGEGAFAASGTCITTQGSNNVWIGTGGNTARVFYSTDRGENWSVSSPPILHDTETAGIFSIAFYDNTIGVVSGGDYKREKENRDNNARTMDSGRTWLSPTGKRPGGLVSGVIWRSESSLIAVGPAGSDYSLDGGMSWQPIDTLSFHAVSKAPNGNSIWAVGANGQVAKLNFIQ